MGGTVSILAAGKAPRRVKGLVLFDPVMWGPTGVLLAHLPFARMGAKRAPIAVQAARRRATFDSRKAAFEAYRGRGAFRGWPDAMLKDYVADGFLDREDGRVELACPPEWELSSYISHAHDPYRALRRFGGPVRILKAAKGSPTRIKDGDAFARRFPGASVETVNGGHFFPMVTPDVVRDSLRTAAN
jgi:pimeloyl-ACP methyl ester carboxylesterase